jgi:hypothetical protein
MSSPEQNRPPVEFTVDGQAFTTEDHRQTAGQLLRLAGLEPANYDLARLLPNDKPEQFDDTDHVTIRPDDRFVSKRTSAQVA